MVRLGGQSSIGRACDAIKRRAKKLLKKFGIVQDEHKTRDTWAACGRTNIMIVHMARFRRNPTNPRLHLRFGVDVFAAFIDIDDDNSGEVGVGEFHKWLGFPATKFSREFSAF